MLPQVGQHVQVVHVGQHLSREMVWQRHVSRKCYTRAFVQTQPLGFQAVCSFASTFVAHVENNETGRNEGTTLAMSLTEAAPCTKPGIAVSTHHRCSPPACNLVIREPFAEPNAS